MDIAEFRDRPVSQQILDIAGALVLLMAVIGVFYFTLQMPIPKLLAGAVAIFFAGIAVARFYYVVKYD